MSRYLKFDDAVEVMACEMYAEAQLQGYDVDGIEDFMPEAKAWMADAPSIDIVFCKECDYKDVYKGEMFCRIHTDDVKPDGFCSYGERKESE